MADLRVVIPATSKRRSYDGYVVDCCFVHSDKKPSMLIWPHRYECRSCGARGTSYKGEQGRREDAAEYVPGPRPEVPPMPIETAFQYHASLGERQRGYYRARGFTDETIDRFMLGYGCPPESSCPRYAIPIIEGPHLVNIKFRLDPEVEDPDAEDAVKYLGVTGHNRPHLWGVSGLKRARKVLVTAGEFDRIYAHQELAPDLYPVTGTGGEMTWLREWTNALGAAEKIYVALDSDKAGRAATEKLCKLLRDAKLFPIPVALPERTKDLGEFLKEDGAAAFRALLPSPTSIWFMAMPAKKSSRRAW